MTGIPNTTLSAIVKGNTKKLDVTKLQAICNALECTLDYLMNDDIKIETLSKEIANSDEVKNFIEFLESADSDSIKLVLKLIDKLGGKNE